MTERYLSVDGERALRATLHVPQAGPWWAEVDLEGDPDLSGAVTLAIGDLELSGTILASQDGTFGLQRRTTVVAGAAGWSTLLPAKGYHNDALVRARTVVEDAAREAGETLSLDDFAPEAELLASDYVRQAGPAARALEDVIGSVGWWVDYDGVTHVGTRETSEPANDAYEVLDHDPRARLVTLAADDVSVIGIGSVLTERLDTPQTVRDLEIEITPDAVRLRAWCGETNGARLPNLLRSIVNRASDGKLWGIWRYRVVEMSGDRVKLQAVRQDAGLPDIQPISMRPGASGVHSDLALGAIVGVQFVEGDRTLPAITHFPGKDQPGWVPVETIAAASSTLRLGSEAADDGVSLSSRTDARFTEIANVIMNSVPTATGDGGASLVTVMKNALTALGWSGSGEPPSSTGSSKVRAE